MTVDELRTYPAFATLPVYDDDDKAGCDSLLRPDDPARFRGDIREARDGSELTTLLQDATLVPKGAIRDSDTGRVGAIFWQRHKSLNAEEDF